MWIHIRKSDIKKIVKNEVIEKKINRYKKARHWFANI